MTPRLHLFALSALLQLSVANAGEVNFPGAKALMIQESSHIELDGFNFRNKYDERRRGYQFEQMLSWKNVGKVPVTAFEVVIVKYDAFNRHMNSRRWVITGKNSADWSPLAPNEQNSDATSGFGTEDVYTSFAYVSAVRLEDGTIWRAEPAKVQAKIRAALPGLRELGDIEGRREDPKKQ